MHQCRHGVTDRSRESADQVNCCMLGNVIKEVAEFCYLWRFSVKGSSDKDIRKRLGKAILAKLEVKKFESK